MNTQEPRMHAGANIIIGSRQNVQVAVTVGITYVHSPVMWITFAGWKNIVGELAAPIPVIHAWSLARQRNHVRMPVGVHVGYAKFLKAVIERNVRQDRKLSVARAAK